jgi:hypothetical protein
LAAHDLRRHGARVEPSAAREQAELHRQADCEMTPQAEPHFGGVVIERQVGNVYGHIEQLVAECRQRQNREGESAPLRDA